MDNVKPEQWSHINMITLSKSGDLSKTKNNRGISLSSVVVRLVNKTF